MEQRIQDLHADDDMAVPMLLVHGMMGEPENWAGVLPHLPATCAPHTPRFPFFESPESPRTIPGCVEFVQGYIEQNMPGEKLVLGGNSLGGHVALHVAMQWPERVAGIMLTGSSGLFEREITGQRGANPNRQWYRDKMQEVFHDPKHVTDELIDRVMNALEGRLARRHLVSIAKSAKRDNLADRLGEIGCPVLLVWGRNDGITPPDVARSFHDLLNDSELSWLDACGHAAMMEQPEALGQAISRWWMKHIVPQGQSSRAEPVA
jgi:pimeloyl-ACP methyl ester carboxylesterase